MIVKTLVENTCLVDGLGAEHGLSLYIETMRHKLLFDTGGSGLFAENAVKMGVDLAGVDLAVISHGHYDHGGGLAAFLQINTQANIYLQERAFDKHFGLKQGGGLSDVGLDDTLLPNRRFIFTQERLELDQEMELFSGVDRVWPEPSGNKDLYRLTSDGVARDNFTHEQNLVIREKGKTILVAGCAHSGIVNIIERYRRAYGGRTPEYVIGGFHLYNKSTGKSENPQTVREIGEYLLGTGGQYYTCHCTGLESYQVLKTVMGDKIGYLSTGSQASM